MPRTDTFATATALTPSYTSSLSQQTVFATPVSRHLPRIRLLPANPLVGQMVLPPKPRWEPTSRDLEGCSIRVLGNEESNEATRSSKAPNDRLGGLFWMVYPRTDTRPKWWDLRGSGGLLVCSIDPPNIAHSVLPDNMMDFEAASRICSLRPRIDRLALSAIGVRFSLSSRGKVILNRNAELTRDAEIVAVGFTEAVIASKAAFTYEVQLRRNGLSEFPASVNVEQRGLREMNKLVEEFILWHMATPPTSFDNIDVSGSNGNPRSFAQMNSLSTLVRTMVARDTFGHYGHASPIYTHSSSSIRRYAGLYAKASDVSRAHAGGVGVEFYVGLALAGKKKIIEAVILG
ncbi:hypothetical protein BDN72DRAFT_855068 [Pluteus cervinus]|uniref:Uncharacterized protein n=1 Tax=Pluteus cervinus TaxID=181527 RepID=A0ACD3B4P8_9AGAR|nr:hypothetical protein BDN72DRAFT_855068 [Pluteus cervinus]